MDMQKEVLDVFLTLDSMLAIMQRKVAADKAAQENANGTKR